MLLLLHWQFKAIVGRTQPNRTQESLNDEKLWCVRAICTRNKRGNKTHDDTHSHQKKKKKTTTTKAKRNESVRRFARVYREYKFIVSNRNKKIFYTYTNDTKIETTNWLTVSHTESVATDRVCFRNMRGLSSEYVYALTQKWIDDFLTFSVCVYCTVL